MSVNSSFVHPCMSASQTDRNTYFSMERIKCYIRVHAIGGACHMILAIQERSTGHADTARCDILHTSVLASS